MGAYRPTPDWRDFKREVLRWDFYKDVFDEQVALEKEVEKLLPEMEETMEEKEIEEYLSKQRLKDLTEVQRVKEEQRMEDEKEELAKLKEQKKKKRLEQRLKQAKKLKVRELAWRNVTERAKEDGVEEVPEQFKGKEQYMKSFLAVFYWECRAQLQRYKETEMGKCPVEKVKLDRMNLDEQPLVRLYFDRTKEASNITQYSMEDLVLLTQEEDLSRPSSVHLLGLVEHSVNLGVTLTVYLDFSTKTSGSRFKEAAELFSARAPWYLAKVTSMATQIREFQGLRGLPEVYLRDAVLSSQDPDATDGGTEMQAASALEMGKVAREEQCAVPQELEMWLQETYNPSQLNAIRDSLKVQGITLVQGPPGTGKTTTVLAILAVLLASKDHVVENRTGRPLEDSGEGDEDEEMDWQRIALLRAQAPWLQPNYVPFSDRDWQEVTGALKKPYTKVEVKPVFDPSDASKTPQKVLVCAPSNAAVDEVLRRVKRDGIMGRAGYYTPPMTRMGPGCHGELKEEFAMRSQVDRRVLSSDAPDNNRREEETVRVMSLARIVFATLAMTGNRDMVGHPEDFDTVVVDEASQGVEVLTLVPLKLGCRRLILIGDPEQLPATVFSKLAKECNYDRSLFQRLQATQYKVNMLNTQYRMHPAISRFPSQHFYNGELLNHLDRQAFEEKYPTDWSKIPCFAPVTFFNIEGDMCSEAQSYINEREADFIIGLMDCLQRIFPTQDWKRKVGIISPYTRQVMLLQQMIRDKYRLSKDDPAPIEVNTVDGFQGNEKDCIIVSLVRGSVSHNKSVGFLKDRRRMNVAFTRARLNLWVVGHARALAVNNDWEDFIEASLAEPEGHARDSWMLRVTPPYEDWVANYYKRWTARMAPEKLSALPPKEDLEDPAKGWHISHEELEELRREEDEREAQENDVEEMVDDAEEAPLVSAKKRKAQDGKSVAKKIQKS